MHRNNKPPYQYKEENVKKSGVMYGETNRNEQVSYKELWMVVYTKNGHTKHQEIHDILPAEAVDRLQDAHL